MKYRAVEDKRYDFAGQSYATNGFPAMHRYPAAMPPQIGAEILRELNISRGVMLDPYCGSGSSFAAGLSAGLREFVGYDLNPLALLISAARFSKADTGALEDDYRALRRMICRRMFDEEWLAAAKVEKFNNFDYWFDGRVARKLQRIKDTIGKAVKSQPAKNIFLLALAATVRECSFARNNEFKLFRMKPESMRGFNPAVFDLFLATARKYLGVYAESYDDKVKNIKLRLRQGEFDGGGESYDVVLTSPPYGDSPTTVAYGQFSFFANAWVLDCEDSRKLDRRMMGGATTNDEAQSKVISAAVQKIRAQDNKRARDVQNFYADLSRSIRAVAAAVKKGGKAVYVAGNRTVKGEVLPTDYFIAEQFERQGFGHLITYKRKISNKNMPAINAPSNIAGQTGKTMHAEYIVVCEKRTATK